MGLTKWLLKNGPGSPGATAKSFLKQFAYRPKGNNEMPRAEVFEILYEWRHNVILKLGNPAGNLYSSVDPNKIIEFSEGDFPLFIFSMMYLETKQFRNSVFESPETIRDTVEVIFETVQNESNESIIFDVEELRKKCIRFHNSYIQYLFEKK